MNSGAGKKRPARTSRKSTKKASAKRATKKSKAPRRMSLPKTAKMRSKRSKSIERRRVSRANSGMSLTELQFLAKSKGIPFGGLSRTKLIKKINNYF